MSPLRLGASCLVAAALAGTAQLEAHEMGTTRVSVMLHADRRYEIDVVTDAASLLEKLETAAGPRALAASAGVPPADVGERLAALDGVFRSRLIVAFDRVGDRPAVEYVVAPATDMAAPVARIRLTGTIPGSAREFAWAYFWTFTSYELSVRRSAGGDPFVESLEAGQTSTPVSLSGLTRSPFMTRWHGYAFPVFVIALSSFVAWCAGRTAGCRPTPPTRATPSRARCIMPSAALRRR